MFLPFSLQELRLRVLFVLPPVRLLFSLSFHQHQVTSFFIIICPILLTQGVSNWSLQSKTGMVRALCTHNSAKLATPELLMLTSLFFGPLLFNGEHFFISCSMILIYYRLVHITFWDYNNGSYQSKQKVHNIFTSKLPNIVWSQFMFEF